MALPDLLKDTIKVLTIVEKNIVLAPLYGRGAFTGLIRLLAGGGSLPNGGTEKRYVSTFVLLPPIQAQGYTSYANLMGSGSSIESWIKV